MANTTQEITPVESQKYFYYEGVRYPSIYALKADAGIVRKCWDCGWSLSASNMYHTEAFEALHCENDKCQAQYQYTN